MSPNQLSSLTGKLLVAMPTMPDPRFAHSVIFMCAHSEEGAMGIMVNKFMGAMKLSEILDASVLQDADKSQRLPIHYGGPVESSRGFVLHSSDYHCENATMVVNQAFSLTATLDVLVEINHGAGPELALLGLGYSGWGPGQLEEEIVENSWLVADASTDLVFIEKDENKWDQALEQIGVDPKTLSGSSGNA